MVAPPHSLQLQSQRVRETDEERKSEQNYSQETTGPCVSPMF